MIKIDQLSRWGRAEALINCLLASNVAVGAVWPAQLKISHHLQPRKIVKIAISLASNKFNELNEMKCWTIAGSKETPLLISHEYLSGQKKSSSSQTGQLA